MPFKPMESVTVRQTVMALVNLERTRQEQLKQEGRFPYSCADSELSNTDCFAILGEEVGEVARAVLEQSKLANNTHNKDLRKELIQVAAVCVAWAERLQKTQDRRDLP